MAYRNGTYIAFHAEGTSDPTASDIRYFNLLKAWKVREDNNFTFINSHDKASAVRDSSKRATLRASLLERLRNSKNMLLIVGQTTRNDRDWVPFEISSAVDSYNIPIIAAYTDYDYIMDPNALSVLWPAALRQRIENNSAGVIHIPFKAEPIADAISQFDHNRFPNGGGLGYYDEQTYRGWGLIK